MRKLIHSCIIISAVLLFCSVDSFAAVWNKETKGTFELSGDYTITSQITLSGDLTLILPADATSDVIITNQASTTSYLFSTNNNSLTIKSLSNNHKIILDGGAIWEEYTGTNTFYQKAQQYACSERVGSQNVGYTHYSLIGVTGGGLVLDNVILRNNLSCSNYGGGAILFMQNVNQPVDISNVIFSACENDHTDSGGAAIKYQQYSYFLHPHNYSNCEFYDCAVVGNDNYGGIFRTQGRQNTSLIINMTDCVFHHCSQNGTYSGDTGVLYWNVSSSGSCLNISDCSFHDNYSYRAVFHSNSSSVISHCEIFNNVVQNAFSFATYTLLTGECFQEVSLDADTSIHDNIGGGILLSVNKEKYSSVKLVLKLNGTKIYKNSTSANGAGIKISKENKILESTEYLGQLVLNGAEIYGNTTTSNGGAVYLSGYCETEIKGGTILGKPGEGNANQANLGGGIYAVGGKCTIEDCTIENNIATGQDSHKNAGSAIYISGSNTNVQIKNGAVIRSNKALQGNGGAFYIGGGTTTIQGGTIESNEATLGNGGGFYVSGGNVTMYGGNIEGNNAKSGAGAYVTGGTLSVIDDTEHGTHTAKTISGNTATENGGGFYVNGGAVTLSNASITTNHAASGAGLFSNGGKVTFTSGAVGSNIATGNGGGMYVNGGSIEFSANLEGNKAANGGGLFLASGAKMTFFGGVISRNRAIASESASATTAYHGGSGIVQGCGGGIYLQKGPSDSKKTTLLFDFSESTTKTFGLYSNEADKAGAEIVSEGGNTQVQLPAISEMQLVGFEGQDASPYWYQDYFTEDTGYGNTDGHAVAGNVTTVDRFKNIMKLVGTQYLEHRIPETRLGEIVNNYLCVTMSFSMLNITLKATGLLGHETAMFKLIRHGTDENTRYDVLLRADDGASKTLRNMPWGTYSVIPNNSWNYAYDPLESKENIRVGETDHYLVEYKMHHKNAAAMPQHDERQIQGKDVPSSTIEGEKPEKYNGSEL